VGWDVSFGGGTRFDLDALGRLTLAGLPLTVERLFIGSAFRHLTRHRSGSLAHPKSSARRSSLELSGKEKTAVYI
jgi:hypothetical protein